MRSPSALAIVVCFFSLPGVLFCETGNLQRKNSDTIETADKLGEDFQKQGPWSRKESPGDGFYGIPQPGEYQTPGSQVPEEESEYNINQYPLCYNPYERLYEYCYPKGSSYYRSRFRSPDFWSWWRRGRVCPPGYYFVPEEGCYKK